jgi:hypothetical protein
MDTALSLSLSLSATIRVSGSGTVIRKKIIKRNKVGKSSVGIKWICLFV